MNPDQLRGLMQDAAVPTYDDDVRVSLALFEGERLVHRRRRRGAVVVASTSALSLTTVGLLVLPGGSAAASTVVLGCAQGVGTSGHALVSGGVGGVTLAVDNPTTQVLSVVSGTTSVLAMPGSSQVTLPLTPGRSTVRCGGGSVIALTVNQASQTRCHASSTSVLSAPVLRGQLADLTRAQLGTLPADAVVNSPAASDDPLERVQVTSSGQVVAEAVWHSLPTTGDWQLESLARCS